jgi:cholesterol oxidase
LRRITNVTKTKGGYDVEIEPLDMLARPGNKFTVKAKVVIFAAGSLGTSKLLLQMQSIKSKKSLSLTKKIGKYFGNNGNVMVAQEPRISMGLKQATVPIVGFDLWENWRGTTSFDEKKPPVFIEVTPLPAPIETKTQMYLGVTQTMARGRLHLGEDGRLDVAWNPYKMSEDEDKRKEGKSLEHQEAMKHWYTESVDAVKTRLGLLVGDDQYKNRRWKKDVFIREGIPVGIAPDLCYHPLGGCLYGKATDLFGRLLDEKKKPHKGIFVIDGSLIPGSLGANPFLTITAISEYIMDRIQCGNVDDLSVTRGPSPLLAKLGVATVLQ